MRFVFIIILSAILSSTTFSPQFLIWVAPFVAFLGFWEITLFVGASSLTWIYFRNWNDVINLTPLATSVLVTRNILLVVLFVISLYKLIQEGKNGKKNRSR